MGYPRQNYWSGLLFPSPACLPDPGTGPASPAMAGKLFTTEPATKPPCQDYNIHNFDTDLN